MLKLGLVVKILSLSIASFHILKFLPRSSSGSVRRQSCQHVIAHRENQFGTQKIDILAQQETEGNPENTSFNLEFKSLAIIDSELFSVVF